MSSVGRLRAMYYHPAALQVRAFLQFGCVYYCLNEYFVEFTTCIGPSMLPTVAEEGEVVFINKTVPWLFPPKMGDVVVAKCPANPHMNICKRIVGMAGDRVKVTARAWYDEDRIVQVPAGHVWLEGDNAANSSDSRQYGPVPMAMVKGKVSRKLWPGLVRKLGPRP